MCRSINDVYNVSCTLFFKILLLSRVACGTWRSWKATLRSIVGTLYLTNDLTAWGRDPPTQLIIPMKLLNKYPTLYGTQKFGIIVTKARHLSQSCFRSHPLILFFKTRFNPMAYTAGCETGWAIDAFAVNSGFVSVDGMTCLIPFESW
jgi:hypothetical protein